MRLGILFIYEVYVVGADHFDTMLLSQLHDDRIGLLLQGECLAVCTLIRIGDFVALNLEVIIVAENTLVPFDRLFRFGDVACQNLTRHLTGETCRTDNEPFGMTLQLVVVGAGTVVETVNPSFRHQFDEVVVTFLVLRQDNQVVA